MPVAVCSTSNERAVSTIVRVMLGPKVAEKMRVFVSAWPQWTAMQVHASWGGRSFPRCWSPMQGCLCLRVADMQGKCVGLLVCPWPALGDDNLRACDACPLLTLCGSLFSRRGTLCPRRSQTPPSTCWLPRWVSCASEHVNMVQWHITVVECVPRRSLLTSHSHLPAGYPGGPQA